MHIKRAFVLFVFLASAVILRADLNVLIIGSDTPGDEDYATTLGNPATPAFQYVEMADHLRQILEGAGLGTVNVTTRNRVAGSMGSYYCNNLATWFYWPYGEWEGNDPVKGWYTSVTGTDTNRWAELRNEGETQWDYVVLIGDPYAIETIPGYYTLGVAKIAEEVAKGTGETVLLMPWPADGSSSNLLNHYKEVVYRTGRTAGVPVAPAGLAWQAAGSPFGTNNPSADGAYIAAATLYSRIFGQSATNSSYNPNPSLASNAYATVTANQGAPQYSGTLEFNNPFKMLGDKRRHILHSLRGTSTEARLRNWLQDYILPDLNITRNHTRDTYNSNTPDDDGLGWPYAGDALPIAFNYGRHQNSAGDGSTKSYFTNRDFWQLGFGFAYQTTADTRTYISYMSEKDLLHAYLMKEGTTSAYSYNLSAYDQQEEIASARLIPLHTLWAVIAREFPDEPSKVDSSHLNRALGRSGATFMYTIYSGRTPVEEDAKTVVIDGNIVTAALNGYAQRVGYETAWILGNVQARAPGLKVTPSTSNPSAASETMSVRFLFQPQEDVTVAVSASDPVLTEISPQTIVFTPENYMKPVEVSVRALQRNTGGNQTYDVQFDTSSDDEVFDGLNDSWSFTLPANAAPSVAFTSPADGAALPAGTDLTVTVDSSDPDGSVGNVKLWLNGTLVRQDNSAPFKWSVGDGDSLLANLADDLYVLKATATDNQGASFTKTIIVKVGAPEAGPPAAPSGFVATASYGSVSLDWNDNAEGDLHGYSVYRSTTSGNYGVALATGLTSSDYTDIAVANGTLYFYAVTATDIFTNESAKSAQLSARPGAGSDAIFFGAMSQGLGGFTTSMPNGTESWSLESNSVRYVNADIGAIDDGQDGPTENGSLLKAFMLDRSAGASYTVEGIVNLTGGYGDDNNRVGIYLFGDAPDINTVGENETGALSLQINTDGSAVNIREGLNGTTWTTAAKNGPLLDDALYGTELVFTADIVFTATGNINVTFTLMDEDNYSTTISKTVAAASYAGNYFGFATRARTRGVTSSDRTDTFMMDYSSFRVTDNNAPMLEGYDLWAFNHGIGDGTNDFDHDGLNNLYEYGLGGNPTNELDRGTLPAFFRSGNGFVYLHPKRADDASLVYTVETTTNLVSGNWTSEDVEVAGILVTGGTLDFVTNEVDSVKNEKFIRLKIGQ